MNNIIIQNITYPIFQSVVDVNVSCSVDVKRKRFKWLWIAIVLLIVQERCLQTENQWPSMLIFGWYPLDHRANWQIVRQIPLSVCQSYYWRCKPLADSKIFWKTKIINYYYYYFERIIILYCKCIASTRVQSMFAWIYHIQWPHTQQ